VVSVLAPSVVDRRFEPRSYYTKEYAIGIWWFSAKYAAKRRMSNAWLARYEDNVAEWGDISADCCVSEKKPTIRLGLVHSGHHHHLIDN
jgi:hypothetical protein